MNECDDDRAPAFWKSPAAFALLVASAVGAYYLLAEHRAHFLGALTYLLVLACPLMHVFMHHGHGHGHGHGRGAADGGTNDEQHRQ